MSYIVLQNGAVTRKPGVYSSPRYIRAGSVQSVPKTLAVVGEFPFLESGVEYLISGPSALVALAPQDTTALRLAQIIWNASRDTAKVADPGPVYLVNMQPTGQAQRTFLDAGGGNSLAFAANQWGPAGGSTYVTIAAGTIAGKKYTIARQGRSESYDNVSLPAVFSVNYTGATATTMTIASDPTGSGIVISFTKTLIAIGTWTPGADLLVDSTLTITPSAAPGGGQTAAALISGVSKTTGLPVSEPIDWPAADGAAKVSTNAYSSITTIVFSQTGGFAGTFTVAGRSLVAQTPAYPFASDVVARLSSATGWTVATLDPRAAKVPTDQLDAVTTVSCKAAAISIPAELWAATTAMARSVLCAVTRAASATLPPANATGYLLGGGTSSTDLASVQAAFAALETEDVQPHVVALLSDDPTWQDELKAHVDRCWAQVASERLGYTGAPADETLANLYLLTKDINDADVNLAFQQVDVTDFNGATVTLDPPWAGLIAASMAAGIAGPGSLLNKAPNVSEVYTADTIDVDRDFEVLLTRGLLFAFHSATGIRWMDDVTTYMEDVDDPFRSRAAPQMSLALCLRGVRAAVRDKVGESATAAMAGQIQAAAKTELENQKAAGTIKDFLPNSIHVVDGGDQFQVEFSVAPMETTRFVVVSPAVTRIAASV